MELESICLKGPWIPIGAVFSFYIKEAELQREVELLRSFSKAMEKLELELRHSEFQAHVISDYLL